MINFTDFSLNILIFAQFIHLFIFLEIFLSLNFSKIIAVNLHYNKSEG